MSYRVFFNDCLFSFLYFSGLNELLGWLIGGKISVCMGHLMDEDWFLKLFRAVEHSKKPENGVKSKNGKKYKNLIKSQPSGLKL
jgi:hypothetical protein